MIISMSQDQMAEFAEKLKALDSVSRMAKALLVGAAVIGAWVAVMNFRLDAVERTGDDNGGRIRQMELKEAAAAQKLQNIQEIVSRIEAKLP